MIRGKCPTCGKSYQVDRIDDLKTFPFCSERCKLVDLGRWIDGAYVLPEKTQAEPTAELDGDVEDEDD